MPSSSIHSPITAEDVKTVGHTFQMCNNSYPPRAKEVIPM